jgi:adenylosuccinate lyase
MPQASTIRCLCDVIEHALATAELCEDCAEECAAAGSPEVAEIWRDHAEAIRAVTAVAKLQQVVAAAGAIHLGLTSSSVS